MQEHELPTWNEILRHALNSLDTARGATSEARDWLNSDWRPAGTSLTDAAAVARVEVFKLIGEIKGLIDQAKGHLYDAERG